MVVMKQCRPANLSIVLGLAFVLVLVYYTLYTEMDATRTDRVSLRLLLRTSIIAAIRGGNEVVKVRQDPMKKYSKGKNQFGKDDPLTEGDIRSHVVMTRSLLKVFPHLNLISEEHKGDSPSSLNEDRTILLDDVSLPESISNYVDETVRMRDVLVWIDPLDATQEYTEELSMLKYVTTMVCIAVKGRPKIGVIHQPFLNRTVWAWVGQGPSKNLKDFSINHENDRHSVDKPLLQESSPVRIVVSRSHAGTVEKFATDSFGRNVVITPAGGAGFKAIQVAENRADLYIHTTLIKKWDICAGNALLSSVGGQMLTLKGELIDYSSAESEKNMDGVLAFLRNRSDFLRLTRTKLPP